jgi:hypothetical protein
MKIKLGKLLNVLAQLIVAVPVVVDAVKPVIREVKGSKSAVPTLAGSGGDKPPAEPLGPASGV